MTRCREQDGSAMVMALLLMAALSLLSAGLVVVINTEAKTSAAYRYGQQAFQVANAGLQRSMVWFNNQYTPHATASDFDTTKSPVQYSGSSVLLAGKSGSTAVYPDTAVKAAFQSALGNQILQADAANSGIYAINATLLKYSPGTFLDPGTFNVAPAAIERWKIDSSGYWGSITDPLGTSEITAMIENNGNPMFDHALWGIEGVTMSGGVIVDSYNSTLGPYGGTNIGEMGSIATNKSVKMSGGVIHGDVTFGPTGGFTTSSGAYATGDVSQSSAPRTFLPIPDFAVGTQDVKLGGGTGNLAPGSYHDISLSGSSSLTLQNGTYYVNRVATSGSSYIAVSGPVVIFVKSDLTLSGGSILNTTQDPRNVTVFYSGKSSADISGSSGFFGQIYCPEAPLNMSGSTGFFGAFIAKTVSNSGGSSVHYDEELMHEFLMPRPFRIITWSQNTY